IVVDDRDKASCEMCGWCEVAARIADSGSRLDAAPARRYARCSHRKARTARGRRDECEWMVEQRAKAADNREPEPHAVSRFPPREERTQRYLATLRLQRTGVEARQVELLPEQCFQCLDGRLDTRSQRLHLGIARARGQCSGEEAHRMQGLTEIVTRGGEELA